MEDEKDGRPAGLSASKRRGGRRLARQMALSVLYQLDFRPELTPAAALDTAAAEAGGDPASKEFALQLVKGVREQVGYFDELIGRYAQNWSLERVATLDRNILRLTLFEMVVGREVPPRVCIDEAVGILGAEPHQGRPGVGKANFSTKRSMKSFSWNSST